MERELLVTGWWRPRLAAPTEVRPFGMVVDYDGPVNGAALDDLTAIVWERLVANGEPTPVVTVTGWQACEVDDAAALADEYVRRLAAGVVPGGS